MVAGKSAWAQGLAIGEGHRLNRSQSSFSLRAPSLSCVLSWLSSAYLIVGLEKFGKELVAVRAKLNCAVGWDIESSESAPSNLPAYLG